MEVAKPSIALSMSVEKVEVLTLDFPIAATRCIYPKLEVGVAIDKLGDMLKNKLVRGTVYNTPSEVPHTVLSLKDTSHVVDYLWIEGNILYADITVLPTRLGKILAQRFSQGEKHTYGLTSRGKLGADRVVYELCILRVDVIFSGEGC